MWFCLQAIIIIDKQSPLLPDMWLTKLRRKKLPDRFTGVIVRNARERISRKHYKTKSPIPLIWVFLEIIQFTIEFK